MLEVVCLNVGTKYPHHYETRLYLGLCRHSTIPFNFRVIREGHWPGWWNKLNLFPAKDRTVFLDLDVVITSNVDWLLRYRGEFAIWGDPWNREWNSSVMAMAPGYGAHIRDAFEAAPQAIMQGYPSDQEFIYAVVKTADLWQDVAPGQVKSYKADNLQAGPGSASIVVFHGKPKPADLVTGWVKEHWRDV